MLLLRVLLFLYSSTVTFVTTILVPSSGAMCISLSSHNLTSTCGHAAVKSFVDSVFIHCNIFPLGTFPLKTCVLYNIYTFVSQQHLGSIKWTIFQFDAFFLLQIKSLFFTCIVFKNPIKSLVYLYNIKKYTQITHTYTQTCKSSILTTEDFTLENHYIMSPQY